MCRFCLIFPCKSAKNTNAAAQWVYIYSSERWFIYERKLDPTTVNSSFKQP